MRKPPSLSEAQLRDCLQNQYHLQPVTVEFLPRGRDYNAGVYRVVSEQEQIYLLKVKAGPLYEPAFLIPRYLRDQGITSVVAPMPTISHALWAKLGDWTVTIYPFIEGDTRLTGMTPAQWQEVGTTFQRIHQVRLPPASFASLRIETFDCTRYTRWIQNFEMHHLQPQSGDSSAARALRATWATHQASIRRVMATLQTLSLMLQKRPSPPVICHADLHAANLLRNPAGHVFVIDWDDVMLALKERDFIFVREPNAEAFFQGYGSAEIDWVALTYYRWERVVQDLIEDTHNVCFRKDLGEATQTDIACTVEKVWAEGSGNIAAAYAAEAHLPPTLLPQDA